FNPAIVPVWCDAQAELAPLSTTLPASELGYFLPDPDMIISSPNDETKMRLAYSWLKLRELFIFRLSSRLAGSMPTLLRNQQWRHLLAVAAGIKYSAETESGRKHEEMRQLLVEYVDETRSGIRLKLEHLSSAPVTWRGRDFAASEELSPTVVQEIVWEISEISFRLELMALDRSLAPHADWEQRQSVLGDCWMGTPFHIDLSGTKSGLGRNNFNSRLPHLQSLFQVMKLWPGPKPILLDGIFPSRSQYIHGNDFQQAVLQVEESIARFYVRTFLNTFKCPATIPRLSV
ncbi:hypothetical protein K435DRAFT_659668, partial [Dendrothele bispora CBS 962.96]